MTSTWSGNLKPDACIEHATDRFQRSAARPRDELQLRTGEVRSSEGLPIPRSCLQNNKNFKVLPQRIVPHKEPTYIQYTTLRNSARTGNAMLCHYTTERLVVKKTRRKHGNKAIGPTGCLFNRIRFSMGRGADVGGVWELVLGRCSGPFWSWFEKIPEKSISR